MPAERVEIGCSTGRGSLLGVQPFMTVRDYSSPEAFHARLDSLLREAREIEWLSERTVVVFPEHIGTWLAACGAPDAVFTAPTVARAMRAIILRNPLGFSARLLAGREHDRAAAALFRMRADSMARIYQTVFSCLALDYGVTVVAGSIVLPNPRVIDRRIEARPGPLASASAVFDPRGRPHDRLVHKIYPVTDELAFTGAAPLESLPTFDTPAGLLGVLICADSWYPAPYHRLREAGVELIAVPSFAAGRNVWERPWQGYDGAPAPADVNPADIGCLTEGQAWRKYAMAGRIPASGAPYGVNVFLRGSLWDLGGDSDLATGVCGENIVVAGQEGAALVNIWLS